MNKGEVIISEARCKGCGYCVHFCPRQTLGIPEGKLSSKGYALPEVVKAEDCTACGICGWLCPEQAIEVYRLVESKGR